MKMVRSFRLAALIISMGIAACVTFQGDWTEAFKLKNGEVVLHTPTSIKLGFMTAGKELNMSGKFNGMDFTKSPLLLKVDSTREEFVKALKASGWYEGN